MQSSTSLFRTILLIVSVCLISIVSLFAQSAAPTWTQWGGPNGNFTVNVKGLANSWPVNGPKQLWNRELGDGYSSIVSDGAKIYTLYRLPARAWQIGKVDQDAIIAMDAGTGKTIWEHRFDSQHVSTMKMENGPGPHATPLIVGDSVFAIGVMANLFCLNRNTGQILWSHDLYNELKAPVRGRGWSSSPVAYKNSIILPLGGPGQSLIAFDQKSGKTLWKNGDPDWGCSTPILINVDGQDQVVNFGANEIFGADPNTGEVLWTHPHKTQWGLNISSPVWGEGNLLFMSSAYNGGSRCVQLTRVGGKTVPKELWFNNRMRIHIGTAIRIGDWVYGSSGDFGPAFLAGINIKDGTIAFQDRSFQKASFVYADGKLILVDEDGTLALATVSPQGLKILSRASLLKSNAWTAPTLVGTRLFIRDRKSIAAFDVGGQGSLTPR